MISESLIPTRSYRLLIKTVHSSFDQEEITMQIIYILFKISNMHVVGFGNMFQIVYFAEY